MMHEAVSLGQKPGIVDLWQFASLDHGGKLPCLPLWKLVAYTCSAGAFAARAANQGGPKPKVNLTVFGPVADDGERLFVSRQVYRYECLHQLPREHAREFNRALFRLILQGKEAGNYPSPISSSRVVSLLGLPPRHGS